MKIQLLFILGCLCLGIAPRMGSCEPLAEYIEHLPAGCINWTQGIVIATGEAKTGDDAKPLDQDGCISQASANAAHHLLQTLKQLRLSDSHFVADLADTQQQIQMKIQEMAAAAKIVDATAGADGGYHITLEINLYGGFAQLMLPADIRQVEPIKPLNGNGFGNIPAELEKTGSKDESSSKSDTYTGLLVDARDVGANPAMVPVLLDENGREVYGPAFVSREYAVQNGLCRYVADMVNPLDLPLIAPNPLRVKGLRTASEGSCDIVISNADASKIRSASSHLEFLKRCRVVIILNENIRVTR